MGGRRDRGRPGANKRFIRVPAELRLCNGNGITNWFRETVAASAAVGAVRRHAATSLREIALSYRSISAGWESAGLSSVEMRSRAQSHTRDRTPMGPETNLGSAEWASAASTSSTIPDALFVLTMTLNR